MKTTFHLSLMILVALAWPVLAAEDDLFAPVPMYVLPDAESLREGVLEAMPGVPLRIEARLQAKQGSGKIETEARAEVRLIPGREAREAVYRVTDAFGGDEERLEVRRPREGPPSCSFYSGEPPVRADAPDLYARIRETDLTWMDLSLSFLWWEGGKTVGRERVRGRFCYVVDTPAPAGPGSGADGAGYSRVKMWIDAHATVLLKAEAFDREGNMVRRLLVDSFKKIDEVWFIKDIDVYSLPSRHKTTLRVDAVEVMGDSGVLPVEKSDG